MITITVPMPEVSKTSNSRVHWRVRAELRRAAHFDGATLARAALNGGASPFAKTDRLYALVTFCPKDKRRRDLDNLFSGIKGEMDGMCSALGIDDSQVERVVLYRNEQPKTGDVVITLMREQG